MQWVKNNDKKYKWIMTFPSDTPFFKMSILNEFFREVNEKESELFFMKFNDKRHNIFGMWSTDLIDQLEKDLDNGSRKVEKWANNIGVKTINMSFEKEDPFFNINTKEDLEKAKTFYKRAILSQNLNTSEIKEALLFFIHPYKPFYFLDS